MQNLKVDEEIPHKHNLGWMYVVLVAVIALLLILLPSVNLKMQESNPRIDEVHSKEASNSRNLKDH